jgi:EpsI family protein
MPPSGSRKTKDAVMDRRGLLIGAGLTALAGVSYLRAPQIVNGPLAEERFRSAIPGAVGEWRSRASSEVVLPPLDESNKLYENLETRIYEADGLPPMMVLVAYSSIQQNDIHVHRPEVCYPAAGFPIIDRDPIKLQFDGKVVDALQLKADRGGIVERIVYWVRVGDDFPVSWASQRLAMARANLQGSVPDGVLFRVSALEEPGQDVSEILNRFVALFVKRASPLLREKILL